MAQHDYVIDNQSAPNVRTDLNQVFAAIASTNGGGTAPSVTYAGQLWHDTTANELKIRNEDNDAWITLFSLDQVNDLATASVADGAVTFAKLAAATLVTAAETIASNDNDSTVPTSAAVKAYADAAVAGVSVDYGAGNAALSAGGVGTYVFASSTTASDVAFGGTRAGSALVPIAASWRVRGTNTTVGFTAGSALSGTWRAMGYYDHETTVLDGATLWLRIS